MNDPKAVLSQLAIQMRISRQRVSREEFSPEDWLLERLLIELNDS